MASPGMDPSIWGRLPIEILERILCFMPLKTVINLRTTCKRLKSLVYRNSFISQYHTISSSSNSCCSPSSSSPFPSFLILSHPHFVRQFVFYDFSKSIWRTSTFPTTQFISPPSSLISSTSGLLCFSIPNSTSLLIRSFFPNSSSIIQPPYHPFSYELLTLLPSRSGFKILVVSPGSSSNSNSIFIYDSSQPPNKWIHYTHHDRIIRDSYHQSGVCRNNSIFFTSTSPFSITQFNLTTTQLSRHAAILPSELTFIRLVDGIDDGGSVYLFGGIGVSGISRSLKLWELLMVDGVEKWVEVETLPDLMYRKFVSVCYHNYEHVNCFWHQGIVCICCYTWPEILYYRVSRRTWHWLPKCPSLPEKWSFGFKWFSFSPNLLQLHSSSSSSSSSSSMV